MKRAANFLLRPVVLWSIAAVLVCAVAQAEESGHAVAEGVHHEVGVPKVVYYQALNLGILVIGLVYLLRKKAQGFFKKRHSDLTVAIQEARRAKDEAEKRHQEYSLKIRNLEKESSSYFEQMRQEGEAAKARMIEEAKRIAETIRAEAKRTVENEINKAKLELREEALRLSLDSARVLLTSKVEEPDRQRLQREFVEKIEAVQ
jgi:F-type H+-transporting ATPase subunit b